MIFTTLIQIAIGIIDYIISLLPNVDSSLVTQINTISVSIKNLLISANYFFPIDTLLGLLSAGLAIEASIFIFKIGRWVVQIVSGGTVKSA